MDKIMKRYYADTYALAAIIKGDKNYEIYSEKELVTTEFNLLELTYLLVRDYGSQEASKILKIFRRDLIIVEPIDEDYIEVALLRLSTRKKGKNLSLIDCLGYVIARRLNIPFLTGDEEFEDMDNVEYVKESRI